MYLFVSWACLKQLSFDMTGEMGSVTGVCSWLYPSIAYISISLTALAPAEDLFMWNKSTFLLLKVDGLLWPTL